MDFGTLCNDFVAFLGARQLQGHRMGRLMSQLPPSRPSTALNHPRARLLGETISPRLEVAQFLDKGLKAEITQRDASDTMSSLKRIFVPIAEKISANVQVFAEGQGDPNSLPFMCALEDLTLLQQ